MPGFNGNQQELMSHSKLHITNAFLTTFKAVGRVLFSSNINLFFFLFFFSYTGSSNYVSWLARECLLRDPVHVMIFKVFSFH